MQIQRAGNMQKSRKGHFATHRQHCQAGKYGLFTLVVTIYIRLGLGKIDT